MATAKASVIDIHDLELDTVTITIVGDTPLIVHAWDEKAKREMLEAQTGKKKGPKHEFKIPFNDFKNSLYWLTEMPENGTTNEEAADNINAAFENGAKFGFPCSGIKQSIISGQKRGGVGAVMTELRGTFFIEGATDASTADLAEIVGPYPVSREDMVRVGGMGGKADIRYRAEFKTWRIPLRLKYIRNGKYSLEQILSMINYGGFCTGIGEWRPEKEGQFGMYHLDCDIS